MTLTFWRQATVYAGPDAEIAAGQSYTLSGATASNFSTIIWSTSGDGLFNNLNALNPLYTPGVGDITAGAVTLTLTSTALGNCINATSVMELTIFNNPTAYAGDDAAICAINETYTLMNATAFNYNTISWTTSGSGSFDDATAINPVYTPSMADYETGQVQLTIVAIGDGGTDNDVMVLTLYRTASVDAGLDASVCRGELFVINGATASNYDSIVWTSNGTGTFNNPNALNPTYKSSIDDINNGTVALSITAYAKGNCIDSTSTMLLNIVETPTANAGKDDVICGVEGKYGLNGSANNEESTYWVTNGTGTFDDETSLSAVYTPSTDDIDDGQVQLTLFAKGYGNCGIASDMMVLSLKTGAEVYAGPDAAICQSDVFILTGATAFNFDSLAWVTSGTGNFNNINALNPTYTPGSDDIVNGSVTLSLTAFGIGACGDSVSTLILTISGEPIVDAGSDSSICSSQGGFGLSATASAYSSILWETSGSGSFADAGSLTSTYLPSAADIADGQVELTISAFGNGTCGKAMDKITLSIWKGPSVYAGKDAVICPGDVYQILDAEAYNFNQYSWTHDGNGVLQNSNTLSPTYISVDGESGIINIILSAAQPDTGVCAIAIDSMQISISGNPTVKCPSKNTFTFNSLSDICGYKITDNSLDATGSVDCGEVEITHNYGNWGNPNSLEGATFPVGTTNVIWTVTDPSGNSVSCTINIIVRDKEVPEFVNCPTGVTYKIGLFPGACEGGAIWNIPVASDNCSEVKVTQTRGPLQGTLLAAGIYQIEYRATDESGNNTFCNFAIEVIDTEKPVIVCQSNLIKESDLGTCNWASTAKSLSPLLANSNCDVSITWDVINPDGTVVSGANDVSGYVFTTGTSTVNYYITENGNNQNSDCSFTVKVIDKQAPVIVCQPTLNVEASTGECSTLITLIPPAFSDNCSNNAGKVFYRVFNPDNSVSDLILVTNQPHEFYYGISRIEWLVYDNAGNYNFCFQNVRVDVNEESIKPDAGPDVNICESDSFEITLASVPNYGKVNWTSSGTGYFTDPAKINTVYVPSRTDIADGYVILTVTSSTDCAESFDQVVLGILKQPVVSASNDAVICESESYQLSGSFSNGTIGIEWKTTGRGTFSNPNISNPVYYPAAEDIAAGEVQIICIGIAAGNCSDAVDTMTIFIESQPIVNAGVDGRICEDENYGLIDALVQNAENVVWTTNGTGTFEDATEINTIYYPSSADILNGAVVLTVTCPSEGTCNTVSDNLVLKISKQPVVSAGNDAVICESESYQLNGSFSNGTLGIEWKTTGTGTFSNLNIFNPVYTPGVEDIDAGEVQLICTGIAEGNCSDDIDTMILVIEHQPILNAGSDGWICENGSYLLADAFVNYTSNVVWSTSGTGLFDDALKVNASYTPSMADIINGRVILTLTSNQIGECNKVSDNVVLQVSTNPTGNAGENVSTCSGQAITISDAVAANYTSIHWSTTGVGILENENTLSPTYFPGENESGTIQMRMQIIGGNACVEDTITDEFELRIFDQLKVDAGDDQTVYANTSSKLQVSVEDGSGKYFYSWIPAVMVNDPNARSTQTYNLTSTTDFEITVTDANSGCRASDTITVFVEEQEDMLLNIFNAFSPNRDGVNDTWVIEGIEHFPKNDVKIFNRWGDKVREFEDYDNINSVWDGTNSKGDLVADGTYYYMLTLKDLKTYTGWVHIRSNQ
jgi:gliding motility-associated-like protein